MKVLEMEEQQRSVASSKTKKPPKRVKARGSGGSNGSSFPFPTTVVCSPIQAANQPGAIELGVVLSVLVISLYLFGFYESMLALPDVRLQTPNWADHMGENFNLVHDEWKSATVGGGVTDIFNADAAKADTKSKEKQMTNTNNNMRTTAEQDALIIAQIPAAKWPVSILDNDLDFETIIHPGDNKTEMSVPKFWAKPIHNGKLMSRETAMKVGSCIEPDEHGNHARGDSCPPDQRTIFLAIASYRDFECRSTVESAFKWAKYPERVRVAVVDQVVDGEDVVCNEPIQPCKDDPEQALCKYKDRVDVYEMEAQLSIGPVFARHIGTRMYRGEYYITQSDAHVTYTRNWDVDIISQMETTKDEMAVLSTYLTDVEGSIDKNGDSKRHTRPIMCNTAYEGGAQGMHLRHLSQPEAEPGIHGTPQLQPWWAAGYSFSRGHFLVNVRYDYLMPMIFQGEEMSIGIRGFTVGYDFYAPERSVCFHHYAVGKNAKIRNKVPHFWENDRTYAGTGKQAMKRLLGIVHMNPEIDPSEWDHAQEEDYGLGGVRTPEKFYELFGIDVHKKTTEKHLCRFVGNQGKMHKMFMPLLRKDGMGIDYSTVDYKFKDPAPHEH
jgi:[Skp1-protein]-hydroxyproline N-acetylglucosaminyltransferase